MVVVSEEDYLAHYGILRRSGRYPWGSGNNQSTRNKMFLDTVADLKRQGLSEAEIARGFDMSTTTLRALKSVAKNEQKQSNIALAQSLKNKGYSNIAAAQRMGIPESSFRALIADGAKERADVLINVSDMLREEVAAKTFVDIGSGVEHYVNTGISKEKLNTAVSILREEGYEVHSVPVRQIGTGKNTNVRVLTPPGTAWGDVARNKDKIRNISSFTEDGGEHFDEPSDPLSIHPNRVQVRYKEDGGSDADGVIYVRPGIEDVSLGKARYAQVRIQVGDGHYIKGMAMYKDNLPPGTDLVFNTNKSSTGNKFDAMKELTGDPDLPFGAVVRQIKADAGTPNSRVTSVMNIVNEEGNWTTWSKNLSTQFLSKQSPSLARAQLDVTFERRKQELDRINALTNPTVRKQLLNSFADDSDSAAVHLEAAALSRRQAWHVILPIDSMPRSQVYAPNYKDGEQVVLVRYPHGGTFEIPELTVNNKHPEARRLLGNSPDAIGIHHSVAERLSGADFDGDTVVVIPNGGRKIITTPSLEGLKNFDPRSAYPKYEGMPVMSSRRKQQEMGNVSNLITDMTIKGAPHSDIVKAVRHSMVVIDAEKHELNWKLSAERNSIAALKQEYQGGAGKGAATLISRATSESRINERKARPASEGGPINRTTGRREFVETGRTRLLPSGERIPIRQRVRKLEIEDDAHVLSSGTRMESIYADHSNRLKDLANQARLAAVNTPPLKYSPSAKKVYSSEVQSLNSKLTIALRNAPLERQAQLIANSVKRAKLDANPHLEGDSLKKVEYAALAEARIRTGAGKKRIIIEPNEWDAIQAGAISNHKLEQILANADRDRVRELATPKREHLMTSTKTTRAKQMLDSGYTRAQVAEALGVSLTTLDAATKG